MKFDKKYINTRITVIVVVAALLMVAIIARAVITATVQNEKWQKLGAVSVSDTMELKPNRGNILSADGQLMASSLPDYKVYVDFLAGIERMPDSIGQNGDTLKVYNPKQWGEKDSMWRSNVDSISLGLEKICPRYTAEEYKERLLKGLEGRKRYWEVCPHVVLNFIQYNE